MIYVRVESPTLTSVLFTLSGARCHERTLAPLERDRYDDIDLESLGGGDSAVAELGTVVSCDRLSNVAHVVFDSNPKRVLTCPFSKLTATPEVRVQPSWIAVSSDLLAKFLPVSMYLALLAVPQ